MGRYVRFSRARYATASVRHSRRTHGGSLRAIAAVAGASPETVRSVRARLQMSDPGLPEADRPPVVRKPSHATTVSVLSVFAQPDDRTDRNGNEKEWEADQALSACGEFTEWFSSTNVGEDSAQLPLDHSPGEGVRGGRRGPSEGRRLDILCQPARGPDPLSGS